MNAPLSFSRSAHTLIKIDAIREDPPASGKFYVKLALEVYINDKLSTTDTFEARPSDTLTLIGQLIERIRT